MIVAQQQSDGLIWIIEDQLALEISLEVLQCAVGVFDQLHPRFVVDVGVVAYFREGF